MKRNIFQKIMYWSKSSKCHRPMGGVQKIISDTRNYSEKTTVAERRVNSNIKIHTLPDTKGTAKSGINAGEYGR